MVPQFWASDWDSSKTQGLGEGSIRLALTLLCATVRFLPKRPRLYPGTHDFVFCADSARFWLQPPLDSLYCGDNKMFALCRAHLPPLLISLYDLPSPPRVGAVCPAAAPRAPRPAVPLCSHTNLTNVSAVGQAPPPLRRSRASNPLIRVQCGPVSLRTPPARLLRPHGWMSGACFAVWCTRVHNVHAAECLCVLVLSRRSDDRVGALFVYLTRARLSVCQVFFLKALVAQLFVVCRPVGTAGEADTRRQPLRCSVCP